MTTIASHLHTINDSQGYCPACGNTKLPCDPFCAECINEGEDVILTADGWESEPMYPYEPLPLYTVGYLSDVTSWCP